MMPYNPSNQIDKIRDDHLHRQGSFNRADVGRLLDEIDRLGALATQLAEAIRLTHEYVDQTGRLLPPIEGWSWWDALVAYDPAYAERVRADIERQRQLALGAIERQRREEEATHSDVPNVPG